MFLRVSLSVSSDSESDSSVDRAAREWVRLVAIDSVIDILFAGAEGFTVSADWLCDRFELGFFTISRGFGFPIVAVLRTDPDGLRISDCPGIWNFMGAGLLYFWNSIAGTGGVYSMPGVPAGLLLPLDLTLTTAAFPRTIVCAGRGLTTALRPYIVVATLLRARLGVILVRA